MTNDAAERLRQWITAVLRDDYPDALNDLAAALAAERRATVERIRAAVDAGEVVPDGDEEFAEGEWHSVSYERVLAILDAEAGR